MTDKRYSDLASGSPVQEADVVSIARGGGNYRLTVSDLLGVRLLATETALTSGQLGAMFVTPIQVSSTLTTDYYAQPVKAIGKRTSAAAYTISGINLKIGHYIAASTTRSGVLHCEISQSNLPGLFLSSTSDDSLIWGGPSFSWVGASMVHSVHGYEGVPLYAWMSSGDITGGAGGMTLKVYYYLFAL